MNSGIEELLDHVDEWKLKLHNRLKGMKPTQRKAFWQRIEEEARARGLRVIEPEQPKKTPRKRARRTG